MAVLSIPPIRNREVHQSLLFLHELLRDVQPRDFAVRLWEGTTLDATPGQLVRFTLVIQHPGALRRMFSSPTQRALGEAYIYNDYDVEGDIESAIRLGMQLMASVHRFSDKLRLGALLRKLPGNGPSHPERAPRLHGKRHTRERDRDAVSYHYNTSNEFYSLFLDERMIYSEANFANPDEALGVAQHRKLENICRALGLRSGERFLDIGCGWGGLLLHAAQHFGVEALGITLSEAQAELARKRIHEAGLSERCRVQICDYRELEAPPAFDKIASIGMVEHVGAAQLGKYFGQAWRVLREGGMFLNSGIARAIYEPARRPDSFSNAYVFPDGEAPPIHELLAAAQEAGFAVQSVEDMREHYALTLRHWVRRLEDHAAEARRLVGDVTYRIWRLYMAGCVDRFLSGRFHVYTTLLVKPGAKGEFPPTLLAD